MWSKIKSLEANRCKIKAVVFIPQGTLEKTNISVEIGKNKTEIVTCVKTLGVFFDPQMKWDDRVQQIIRKLSRVLGILCRLRFCLPQYIKLFNALFHLQISYCFLVWGTTTKTNINTTLTLQKKCTRMITSSPFDVPSQPLFELLNILRINKLYNFLLMSKHRNSVRSNNRFFDIVSNLTLRELIYSIHHCNPWNISFRRTDTGKTMLKQKLPCIQNDTFNKEIDIFQLSRKSLKHNSNSM